MNRKSSRILTALAFVVSLSAVCSVAPSAASAASPSLFGEKEHCVLQVTTRNQQDDTFIHWYFTFDHSNALAAPFYNISGYVITPGDRRAGSNLGKGDYSPSCGPYPGSCLVFPGVYTYVSFDFHTGKVSDLNQQGFRYRPPLDGSLTCR